jgi:hypothetical protein
MSERLCVRRVLLLEAFARLHRAALRRRPFAMSCAVEAHECVDRLSHFKSCCAVSNVTRQLSAAAHICPRAGHGQPLGIHRRVPHVATQRTGRTFRNLRLDPAHDCVLGTIHRLILRHALQARRTALIRTSACCLLSTDAPPIDLTARASTSDSILPQKFN